MSREQVGNKKKERDPNEKPFIHLKSTDFIPGEVFVGKYFGSYVDKTYGGTRYMLKTAKGNMLVFKALVRLKDIFSALQKGDVVEIKYIEKIKLDNGKTCQIFEGTKLLGKDADYAMAADEEEEKDDGKMPF